MRNFIFKILPILAVLVLIDHHMVEGLECYSSKEKNGVAAIKTCPMTVNKYYEYDFPICLGLINGNHFALKLF